MYFLILPSLLPNLQLFSCLSNIESPAHGQHAGRNVLVYAGDAKSWFIVHVYSLFIALEDAFGLTKVIYRIRNNEIESCN